METIKDKITESLIIIRGMHPDNAKKVLQYVAGYMAGCIENIDNQTDGYIAFDDGLTSGIIEYGDD